MPPPRAPRNIAMRRCAMKTFLRRRRVAKPVMRNMKAAFCLWVFWVTALLSMPSPLMATPFAFGFSPAITVPANQEVLIPAAIINLGASTIDFGCAFVACGGPEFGAGVAAAPGEGL